MRKTSHTQHHEPFLEYILSEIRCQIARKYIQKNSIVADLGCGYHGKFLIKMSPNIKYGEGYDVAITNKGLPKNIVLRKSDLNRVIGNRKNYFNYVTALAILEHVRNPETFLKKAKILLKVGGEIIITAPHKRSKKILEILSFKLGLVSREEIEDHKHYFDAKSLGKLLKKLGFKIIKLSTFELGLNLLCIAKKYRV